MFEQMETRDFTTYALLLCVNYNGSLKKFQGSAFNNGMSAVRCSAQEWGVPSCWSWAHNVESEEELDAENKSTQHNSKNNIASHWTWSVTWKLVLLKQTIMTRLINVCGLLARSHTKLRGWLTLTDAWKGTAASSKYLMEAWRFGSSGSNANDYMVLQVLKRIQFFLNK
jgi:hypothetical protein